MSEEEKVAQTKVAQAFEIIQAALQNDPDYAWSWQSVIAMCCYDEVVKFYGNKKAHEIGNKAAANFMSMCYDVDMTKHPHYAYKGESKDA